jgi:hypothetical protein
MGGRGSGRRATFGLDADLCHRSHSIDLARLNREWQVRPRRWSILTWSARGKETGSIRLTATDSGIVLCYRARSRAGEWRDILETVPLETTATNFGGRRRWFKCLSCERRCRILYGGELFRCRKCHGLRYESQYEPSFGRAATRALKIREKLGDDGGLDDPFPPKPKGMHWRTYRRLEAREQDCQEQWASGTSAWMRGWSPTG